MPRRNVSRIGEDEWSTARRRARIAVYAITVASVIIVLATTMPAEYLANVTSSGRARYPMTALWLLALIAPIAAFMSWRLLAEQARSDEVVAAQARRQEFESRLANALDMAEGEHEVIDVIERSFSTTVPDFPIELLLADNSHAHLTRTASASPTGSPPGCTVDSPDHCPAARRAQVQKFANSDDLDACPKLRGRPDGALSALCVPVSIMGRTVGVIHATGEAHVPVAESTVQDLGTLAKLAGARIGLLRVMVETQIQASTDNLTGLLNRRTFEHRLEELRQTESNVAVAMADLDHFKILNDTYGHETGDRALRVFAQVLGESVRSKDLVSRHGGEEFVIAFPDCAAESARRILDTLRERLDVAISNSGLPKFTVSFGVVDTRKEEDVPTAIGRADVALFEAKEEGRDRVVVHDAHGQVVLPSASLTDSQSGNEKMRNVSEGPLRAV